MYIIPKQRHHRGLSGLPSGMSSHEKQRGCARREIYSQSEEPEGYFCVLVPAVRQSLFQLFDVINSHKHAIFVPYRSNM
jgi:hypothetical protein